MISTQWLILLILGIASAVYLVIYVLLYSILEAVRRIVSEEIAKREGNH